MASPTLEIHNTSISRSTRPLLELAVGYGLILATIWTPRPYQAWLWWTSAVWIALTTMRAFPGWEAMGFRRGGFLSSLWVVFAAGLRSATAILTAIHIGTVRHPISTRSWIMTFGGYTLWSFVQQFLLQGYFLIRFLRLLPRREWAAVAAAVIFAAAGAENE